MNPIVKNSVLYNCVVLSQSNFLSPLTRHVFIRAGVLRAYRHIIVFM